jgi:hypothetical protein
MLQLKFHMPSVGYRLFYDSLNQVGEQRELLLQVRVALCVNRILIRLFTILRIDRVDHRR